MSLPYYGGMRHINVVPGIVDQAAGEIRNLQEDEVGKVLDFIGQLKGQRGPVDPDIGTGKALLRHADRFSFNEGEREALLSQILQVREAGIR